MISQTETIHESTDSISLGSSFARNLSATDLEMFLGPALNNLSNGAPAGVGKHPFAGGPGGGDSIRHELSVGYAIDEDTILAPVLDVSQPLTAEPGETAGELVMNDPQLRLTLKNVFDGGLFGESYRSNLLISAYAPVSERSRDAHSQGALSVSITPHLQLSNSKFSFSGLLSAKSGMYESSSTSAELVSTHIFDGVQTSYLLSPKVETFLMLHTNFSLGARIDMEDAGLPAQTFTHEHAAHAVGLMNGTKFQVSRTVSFTPRLNWYLDQPIQATTIGLNVSIRLI
jgi:hypothetical protein